ncbi:hypothetical protein K458DRAFT_484090 [Lentithecium fluviatile CBS 122367]|uniref:Uncharacterized protein n=1 Tax=Lentithecium fluviatile CBS 122367 TaxID=1168545 RepID=A0A6G1JGN5_9PLEO|nr:hypothetical protein K458DRAFT_484090 [Lentithecium fluviatile CBS 122367]
MIISSLLTTSLLVPLVASRGGGGGGRGGGGGSGGSGGGGGGASFISYTAEECYTGYLGAVEVYSNGTDAKPGCTKIDGDHGGYLNGAYCYYIWDDQFHNETRNYVTTGQPLPSWQMEVTDTYYNGSFSMTLTPPSKNDTFDCPTLQSQTIPNMFLRLGPQSKGNVSRAAYGDNNPYYMHFGRTIFEQDCPKTENKAFVNFESSCDNLEQAQIWNLTANREGEKWTLEGELTSTVASYNNFYNYLVNTTGSDNSYPTSCKLHFQIQSMLAKTAAKFNATVTPDKADLSFSFTDTETQWQVQGSFSGTHWEKGPKLLFSSDKIETEGQVEHVKPRAPKDRRLWIDKYLKYILIAVGVVVLIGIIWFLWKCAGALLGCLRCCFPCCKADRRAARRNKKNMTRYQASLPSTLPADQPYGTPQMSYAAKTDTTEIVTSVLPHDPRDSECNYAVSPTVMQSYYIRDGKYLVEIANSQTELHGAQRDLLEAAGLGQEDRVGFARAMVGHHTAVIEHFMALRAAGM